MNSVSVSVLKSFIVRSIGHGTYKEYDTVCIYYMNLLKLVAKECRLTWQPNLVYLYTYKNLKERVNAINFA